MLWFVVGSNPNKFTPSASAEAKRAINAEKDLLSILYMVLVLTASLLPSCLQHLARSRQHLGILHRRIHSYLNTYIFLCMMSKDTKNKH